MKKFISHTILLLSNAIAIGQTVDDSATTSNLNSVEINYFTHVNGIKQVKIDENSLIFNNGKSLADVLRSNGSVYIKQYAPGQLSTISMRGSNASQVQVLWKGFNLNNLSLGLTDFSLIPTNLFNNVTLNMGSVGATGGNGVVAGGIELNNFSNLLVGEKFSIEGGFNSGSFGRYAGNLSLSTRIKNAEITIKPFYSSIKNNFSFLNSQGNSVATKHASSLLYGSMATVNFQLKKDIISIDTWLQSSHREIPATIDEPISTQTQDDKLIKIAINHGHYTPKYILENHLAYFYDELNYYQSPLLESGYKTNNILGESVFKWHKFRARHSISINGSLAFSENSGYSTGIKQMGRTSIGYFYESILHRTKIGHNFSFAVKEELNTSKFSIPILQTGLAGNLWRHVKKRYSHFVNYKLNGGTVYRFPTLNDRFWSPGGNPDLKPEKGFNGNGTISFLLKNGNYPSSKIQIEFTHFERYVYDWIMWQPRNGYWTPQNLLAVWSRGNETVVLIEFGKKIRCFSKSLFNYTLSTQEKSEIANDNSIGRQLIYTPMYNVNCEAGIKFASFTLSGNYSYYGYRYTSSDNYEYLSPFHLVGARILWGYKTNKFNINMYAEVDNILNVNYYWVAQRPALPRNFNVGFILKMIKEKK